MNPNELHQFPKWVNKLTVGILVALVLLSAYLGLLFAYGANPTTLNVGYQPKQPVPYSHAIHVGKLGIDCRYCHNTVEKAGMAAVPPTDTCMNCHRTIWWNADPAKQRESLKEVFKSYQTGKPIPWVKVHDLPDYVYFNHSAHVNVGLSCVECHGQVNKMDEKGVHQVAALNMAWCVECHRDPVGKLRPKDRVTNLDWVPPGGKDRNELGRELAAKYHVNANTDCVTCHR